MEQPCAEVAAQAVAVLEVCAIELLLTAIGAIPPGFLAGIAARPFAPAQLCAPLIHQLALQAPALEGLGRQLRAAGGAGEQVEHQAGGVIARVADHVRQGAAQFGRVVNQLALQPSFGGHQIKQLHHAGGVASLIAAPGGTGWPVGPEVGQIAAG